MLDVIGSIKNLEWNTEHHFQHIKQHHEFIRIWAIQFELGYTDFRTIQLALQLDGNRADLLEFTTKYNEVYKYEYSFVKGGLEGFIEEFGDQIDAYDTAHREFADVLTRLETLVPATNPDEENLI